MLLNGLYCNLEPSALKFGRGVGGSTLVNVGVYTRGDIEDYERFGGTQFWNVNRTLENFKFLEAEHDAPGFPVDYRFHPKRNVMGLPVTLVSPFMNELPKFLRVFAEAFDKGIAPYRVDPHGSLSIEGLGGTWRLMGCSDRLAVSCSPQRVSRWRYTYVYFCPRQEVDNKDNCHDQ